jgi:hypothetical protein
VSGWPETWIDADLMQAEGAKREDGKGKANADADLKLGEKKGLLDDDNATLNGTGPETEAEVGKNG